MGRDNTHLSGQTADAYTRKHMAASEGSLGGAGSISAAPEGPDERSPDSRPTYFLHFGRVGWSQRQMGRFSTHMVRLAAQPPRSILLERQVAGMRWLSYAYSTACHSVWHTPGFLILPVGASPQARDSQPAHSTTARAPPLQHHHYSTLSAPPVGWSQDQATSCRASLSWSA